VLTVRIDHDLSAFFPNAVGQMSASGSPSPQESVPFFTLKDAPPLIFTVSSLFSKRNSFRPFPSGSSHNHKL